MRLLHRDSVGNISQTPDLQDSERPKYAILSHTWSTNSTDEVTLEDLTKGVGTRKPGYEKIRFCAQQARQDGLEYFWIDTCCINKTNDAELSKSLISMFRWYAEAERCYVFLSDVSRGPSAHGDEGTSTGWMHDFQTSRWFGRGWTLQELLAPAVVEFFSSEGYRLGTKDSLERQISEISHIPIKALRSRTLSDFTVQERFQWQQGRKTKEPEDIVYSLLGIFDISMPVLYGEGKVQARRRLENEITNTRKGLRHKDFSLACSMTEAVETQHFVAREAELREIQNQLSGDGTRRYVVLRGLGGIGKTQLAIRYAVQYRDNYSAFFWLNARDKDTIKSSFAKVARQILRENPANARLANLDLEANLDDVVDTVKDWLSMPMNTRWLMVCDNYDNPKLLGKADPEAFDLREFLPEAYQGFVIITTRSAQVQLGHCVHIQKLKNVSESLQILSSSSGRGDLSKSKQHANLVDRCLTRPVDAEAIQLTRELDGLPLALATAGAYLSQTSVSFAKYLDFLERSWAKLQRLSPALMTYEDRTLFSTWQVSYEQIERQNGLSAKLLRWWAYFDNQDLWFELLQSDTNGTLQWMKELTQDELDFQASMQVLCDHGLVEFDGSGDGNVESQGYSVHTCVHSWMQAVLNTQYDEELAKAALRCVASNVSERNSSNWSFLQRRLLNHASRCVSSMKEEWNTDGTLSWSFHKVGNLYTDLGRMVEAEQMYSRALEGNAKAQGPAHTNLDTLNNLGVLYARLGRVEEAEKMYKRALQGKKKAWGPEHTSTLETINNMGILYKHMNRMDEAEQMYIRALRGKEKTWGPGHMSTLNTINNLGALYGDLGRTKDAEQMYTRALRGKEKACGPEHTSTLGTVNNLGLLYADLGWTEQAEQMYIRALQGLEKAWGLEHILTLDVVNNLGLLYADLGRTEEAEQMYTRALQGKEKAWGLEHTSTLETVNNLGLLYADLGRTEEAKQMYLRLTMAYKSMSPKIQARADALCQMLSRITTGQVSFSNTMLPESPGMGCTESAATVSLLEQNEVQPNQGQPTLD